MLTKEGEVHREKINKIINQLEDLKLSMHNEMHRYFVSLSIDSLITARANLYGLPEFNEPIQFKKGSCER